MIPHWMWLTAIMFGSSVVLYTSIQKATAHGMSLALKNLTIFASPLVVFVIFALVADISLQVSWRQLGLLVPTGMVVYANNLATLKSLERTPNPGYSLSIAKSYVVLTTLVAVPLFGAHLSFGAIISILLIVGFMTLLSVDPTATKQQNTRKSWIAFALVAMVLTALITLMAKYLSQDGLPTITILVYFFGVGTVCTAVELVHKRVRLGHLQPHLKDLSLIGVANVSFNYFNYAALVAAPNVGYVNAANAASIGAITVASVWLLGAKLTTRKLIGVFGIVGSLWLLLAAS